jgi:beta-glucosidase
MKTISTTLFSILGIAIFVLTGCGPKYTIEEQDDLSIIHNKGGQTLGYAPGSGVTLIEKSGFAFKDLNKNGTLDAYEDWRLPVDDRAKDLVSLMSVEEMAGLMLYSAHQSIPSGSRGFFGASTYW